jgi:long-chain acyl-CoA synthetase
MNVSQVTLLHEYLERSAERFQDKAALICQDQRLTWGAIDRLANQLARALRGAGVTRGDRVVIYLDNSVEACVSIFGVLRADAVFSVINPQTKAEKLAYMLNDCRAKVIITDVLLARVYNEVMPQTPHLTHAFVVGESDALPDKIGKVELHPYGPSLEREDDQPLPASSIPIDLASIIYTSGTTGDPKGVMLTHHNMVSAAESITTYLQNVAEDIVVGVLPLSFDYGLYQWLMVNQFSGTLVLERSFNYPTRVIDLVRKENVTGFPVVPTIVSLLRPLVDKGLVLENIRYTTNTAAALSGSHIETLRQAFPAARIYSMYGLTECKRVAYLPPEQIEKRPDSVGKAMPNMEAFVVDAQRNRVPAHTVGELVVRGPHVMAGYWEKPEATAERLKPGQIPGEMHLYTGDYFRMDEDGYLYFVGRRDDIIKSRGEKVSPKEVENVLYSLPGVAEAAVVGVPDELFGQAIKAYLVLSEEAEYTPRKVISYCAQHLEPFMVPKYVTFLSALPKTTSNKITKKNLEEWAKRMRVGGD